MQIVRTIAWFALLVVLLTFSFFNWKPVEVQIWDNLVLETKVPALVVVSFLLGLVPMWLIHRGVKWRLQRRIAGLETAARNVAMAPSPAASSAMAAVQAPSPDPDPHPGENAPGRDDDTPIRDPRLP
jgi:lipopolysaccharide assembly protein A